MDNGTLHKIEMLCQHTILSVSPAIYSLNYCAVVKGPSQRYTSEEENSGKSLGEEGLRRQLRNTGAFLKVLVSWSFLYPRA